MDTIAATVSRLKPGMRILIDRAILNDAVYPLPGWTPAEWVMEQILGAAYEFRHWVDPQSGNVFFERLEAPLKDGRRTYVSPDRRHLFEFDGLTWRPRVIA